MLFQVGGQGTRPTFFEMAAAQQLPASLRAAITYSVGVMALRRPILHKVLDYEDEFFALLMLVLEAHSMRTTDASFSESLYGLRRRAVKTRLKKDALHGNTTDGIQHSGLEKHQKVLSVVFLVVLPYFKSKLHSIYTREREAALQARLWGSGDERFDDADVVDIAGSPVDQTRSSDAELSSRARILIQIKKAIGACYPWIHAGHEGVEFVHILWKPRISICLPIVVSVGRHWILLTWFAYLGDPRLSGYWAGAGTYLTELLRNLSLDMDASSRISRMRSRERERLRGPPWLKKLQGALLTCMYAVLDYAQTGLIASVFIFKMMEWWYQSAEERMSAPTIYPPPPPPPAPKVAREGIPLPSDKTICPLCSEKRANPSVVTVSGFVFCYSCIFKYISQYKRCPVTLIPAQAEDIRRLYHDM